MWRSIAVATFVLLHLGFSGFCADVTLAELFHADPKVIELAVGPERYKRLQNAVEDFNAILNFKKPVHATIDRDAPIPLDGGTHYYQGMGYRLTWVQSGLELRSAEDTEAGRKNAISGFMFGPILKLEDFGIGFTEFSKVSFYPVKTLGKLLQWPETDPKTLRKIPGLEPVLEAK